MIHSLFGFDGVDQAMANAYDMMVLNDIKKQRQEEEVKNFKEFIDLGEDEEEEDIYD